MSAPILLSSDTGEQLLWLGPIYEGNPPDPDVGTPGVVGECLFYPASGAAPYPAQWVKTTRAGAWAGPYTAPAGSPGTPGPAGAFAPWVTATAYTANVSVVSYRASLYQCVSSHTSAAAFETDALAGKWQLLNGAPPETFPRMLCQSATAINNSPRTTYMLCPGGGLVNTLWVRVGTAAGNIAVGVHRGSGGGERSTPTATGRVFLSGTVAATAGWMSFATGGLFVLPGDFLFVYGDTTTLTLNSASNLNDASASGPAAGACYYTNTTPVVDGTTLQANIFRGFLVVGQP